MKIEASDITDLISRPEQPAYMREIWDFDLKGRKHRYVTNDGASRGSSTALQPRQRGVPICEIYDRDDPRQARGIERGPFFVGRYIPMPETNREQHIANLLNLTILC